MKVAVIGAGASGLVAAYQASKKHEVVVFEGNSNAGKKLLLTGSGRCNIGNVNNDLEKYHSSNNEYISNIVNDNNILLVRKMFDDIGLVIKNKNGYLYPYSEKSSSVLSVLKNACINNNVKFSFCTLIENVYKNDEGFVIDNEFFDKVIVATGGISYPKTGSTGIGVKIAKSFGHSFTKLNPCLMPVLTNTSFEKDWAGIRCEADVSLYENNMFLKKEHGELQFTSYGLSGICIFNLSRNIRYGLNESKLEELRINFVPWCLNIKEYFESKSNMCVSLICDGFLDYKLTNILLKYIKVDANKKWGNLLNSEKEKICEALTGFKANVYDTKDFLDAQVTSGGISLDEVNLGTMESKIVPNLRFAGEILDLDGDCGGYNLTIAFITGLLAGGLDD